MKNEPNDWHGQNCLTFLKDQVAFCIMKTKTKTKATSPSPKTKWQTMFVSFFPMYNFFFRLLEIFTRPFRISLDLVSGTGMTGIVNRQPGNEVDNHHELVMMIFDKDHK